jgi:hypothetical protein
MSGSLVALTVFGVVGSLFCLCTGVALAVAGTSEYGKQFVSVLSQSTRAIAEGGDAPGAKELQAAGCPAASVMDMRELMGGLVNLLTDGGPLPEEDDYLSAQCVAPAGSTMKLPTCEALASIYAKAVPSQRDFVILVGRTGAEVECRKKFTGDGEFIKDVER